MDQIKKKIKLEDDNEDKAGNKEKLTLTFNYCFANLNPDVLLEVFELLPKCDLDNASKVCRR